MRRILLVLLLSLFLITPVFAYTNITTNQTAVTWTSGTYYIANNITLQSAVVYPGVVIKLGAGVLVTGSGGRNQGLTFNGTDTNPVYITSWNDNSVGDTISGSSGNPAPGDYVSFYYITGDGSSVRNDNFTGVVYKYGTYAYYANAPYGNGGTSIVNNCEIAYFTNTTFFWNQGLILTNHTFFHDISVGGGFNTAASGNINNSILLNITGNATSGLPKNVAVINCSATANVNTQMYGAVYNITNFIAIDCVKGIHQYNTFGNGGTINVRNSIFWNVTNATKTNEGSITSDFNIFNNVTVIGNTMGGNDTNQTANFTQGAMNSSVIWKNASALFFLNQTTSPAIDSGNGTYWNGSAYTTNINASVDTGTLDRGFHYTVTDVNGTISGGAVATGRIINNAVLNNFQSN